MRTLVTGANGHLGANLCRELIAAGHSVRAFVRKTSDLSGLTGLDVELFYGDVRDRGSLETAATDSEIVFHTAAVFNMSGMSAEQVVDPALEGTRHALAAARTAGVRRVVYTSSAHAVGAGRKPHERLDESHWNNELNTPYAAAKTQSEREAHRIAEELDVDLVVLNPSVVVGPYDYKPTPASKLLGDYLNGKGMVGAGGMSWVDVRTVARAHLTAAERGRRSERYILAGEPISFLDTAKLIKQIGGKRPTYLSGPRGPALASVALLNRATRLLGRDPIVSEEWARTGAHRYWYHDSSKAERELGWCSESAESVLREGARWLAFAGKLEPSVAKRVRAETPPDPRWGVAGVSS